MRRSLRFSLRSFRSQAFRKYAVFSSSVSCWVHGLYWKERREEVLEQLSTAIFVRMNNEQFQATFGLQVTSNDQRLTFSLQVGGHSYWFDPSLIDLISELWNPIRFAIAFALYRVVSLWFRVLASFVGRIPSNMHEQHWRNKLGIGNWRIIAALM